MGVTARTSNEKQEEQDHNFVGGELRGDWKRPGQLRTEGALARTPPLRDFVLLALDATYRGIVLCAQESPVDKAVRF